MLTERRTDSISVINVSYLPWQTVHMVFLRLISSEFGIIRDLSQFFIEWI